MGIFDFFRKNDDFSDVPATLPNPSSVTEAIDPNSIPQDKLQKDLEALNALNTKIAAVQEVKTDNNDQSSSTLLTALKIKNPFRGE